mgnify:CR=1 FL=1
MPKCVVCGKKATFENTLKLPSCETHQTVPTDTPICPNCDCKMVLTMEKNGGFWRCPDYPTCFGTHNLFDPNEVPDIL